MVLSVSMYCQSRRIGLWHTILPSQGPITPSRAGTQFLTAWVDARQRLLLNIH